MRVRVVVGPAAKQRALLGEVEDSAGEPGLSAESKWPGTVGQDDLVPPGPAEEPPQHVGVLMPVRGLAGKEVLRGRRW